MEPRIDVFVVVTVFRIKSEVILPIVPLDWASTKPPNIFAFEVTVFPTNSELTLSTEPRDFINVA